MENQADRMLIGRPGDTQKSHWKVEAVKNIWSLNRNSTWKTHHHLQLRLITPPCGSAPPVSVKSAFLPGQSSFKAPL
ncbi:hypothetical protein ATANTOWER_006657 [Ataeniobius toweri]|uniref:Uncharacterized protein n=1 Tax=Ataeniobius toweri TaxID=208326 RepID=A0ABU7A5H4_9TELE|nr:hypothetical protein [Ataeniobius toweri]